MCAQGECPVLVSKQIKENENKIKVKFQEICHEMLKIVPPRKR